MSNCASYFSKLNHFNFNSILIFKFEEFIIITINLEIEAIDSLEILYYKFLRFKCIQFKIVQASETCGF